MTLQLVSSHSIHWYNTKDGRDGNKLEGLSATKLVPVLEAILQDGDYTDIVIKKS